MFWRTTPNLFILALLCSLYSRHTFQMHLGPLGDNIQRQYCFHNFKCSYNAEVLNPYYSNQCNMAQLQTTFSFWLTTSNLFISTLWSSLYNLCTF